MSEKAPKNRIKIIGIAIVSFFLLMFVGNLLSSGLREKSSDQSSSAGRPDIASVSDSVSEPTGSSTGVPSVISEKEADFGGDAGAEPAEVRTIAQLPPLGDKVIKTGLLGVKVKKGGFDRAYDRALFLATSHGGYVGGSSVLSSNIKEPVTGTITLKVPSSKFERLMGDLRKLGKVQSLEIASEDISQEYVDLKSRLRSWRAQEVLLLRLMSKASSISDSITIHSRLSEIQEQIETITGRINYLDAQTSMSTIQLTIMESGKAPHDVVKDDKWGTLDALKKAAHAAVDTLNFTVIAIGYMLPWLAIATLTYLVYRRTAKKSGDKAVDKETGGA